MKDPPLHSIYDAILVDMEQRVAEHHLELSTLIRRRRRRLFMKTFDPFTDLSSTPPLPTPPRSNRAKRMTNETLSEQPLQK